MRKSLLSVVTLSPYYSGYGFNHPSHRNLAHQYFNLKLRTKEVKAWLKVKK